ncbi:GATA transcription factor 1 [Senna tora]|uniref:GATA transcription factor 1 n=1 Tax=Senna tora TaxID=362788 RepID=A0A834X2Q0_9FABA|nr:GATA transcription factor 1 [Senna tora]
MNAAQIDRTIKLLPFRVASHLSLHSSGLLCPELPRVGSLFVTALTLATILAGMECLSFVDDLLDFSSDLGEKFDVEDKSRKALPSDNPKCSDPATLNHDDPTCHSFSEFAEEELEWLSNKDAFPAIETFDDMLCSQPNISKHQNTVSVLEYSASSTNSNNSINSSALLIFNQHIKVPVRARSRRQTRRHHGLVDTSSQPFWWSQESEKIAKAEAVITISSIGRKCQHCGAEKTPQWRAGPLGPKTLCNACGVRYKSGRLVPEYRPASSPTFCSELHSNSHRKVMEMRNQKQMGMVLNAMDKH